MLYLLSDCSVRVRSHEFDTFGSRVDSVHLCVTIDTSAKRIMDYLLSKMLFGCALTIGQETERIHASELRHMIANMAHDLKTVSFLSSLHHYNAYSNPFVVLS